MEQNIILYDIPGSEIIKQSFLESPVPEYQILGESFVVHDTWAEYDNMTVNDVFEYGTHCMVTSSPSVWEFTLGRWYKSKEKMEGDFPFAGFLTNKKWPLNEVLE